MITIDTSFTKEDVLKMVKESKSFPEKMGVLMGSLGGTFNSSKDPLYLALEDAFHKYQAEHFDCPYPRKGL